jgi:hypothetical protein
MSEDPRALGWEEEAMAFHVAIFLLNLATNMRKYRI